MATFYLETKMGQFTPETVVFKEAIDQYNWLYPASRMDAIYFDQSNWDACLQAAVIAKSRGVENVIPVGSIQFVEHFCNDVFGFDGPMVKALNVPPELQRPEYLHRKVWPNVDATQLKKLRKQYGDLLVKSGNTPKRFELARYTGRETFPDNEPLFVSTPFEDEILSEWRVFCLNGEIKSIHPYGPVTAWKMPDVGDVLSMVRRVTENTCPSFALDVAVLGTYPETYTAVVEVHPFISCGLYGFEGPEILKMAIAAWRHFIKEAGKNA